MAMSKATTVAAYLEEQPPERRAELEKVIEVVRKHLPKGYRETMAWGMIGWGVPLERYPDTYNGQPLCYAGLAAQKHYNSLYLMGCYVSPEHTRRLEQAFADAGLELDMGKSCVHFRRAEDLPLAAIGKLVAGWPVAEYIAAYEAARARPGKRGTAGTAGTAKAARKAKPSGKQPTRPRR
jgi:hypothetical protein